MAVGEAEINAQQAQHWSYLASIDDTPESIAASPAIAPESIQEAVEKLERVLSKGPEEHQEVSRCLVFITSHVSSQDVTSVTRNAARAPADYSI